jgi:hypothetical protein
MADYYPLIARAVGGLEKNTGENRRALYERARSALVNQLRGVDPPLEESDITRERLALEESIRKVELDASKRTRSETSEPEERQSLRDQGLRDFRGTVAEAEALGDASAEANRSAHAAYDAVPGEQTSEQTSEQASLTPSEAPEPDSEPAPAAPYFASYSPPLEPAPHDTPYVSEPAHEPLDLARDLPDAHARERTDDPADDLGGRYGDMAKPGWQPPPPVDDEDDAYARPPRDWGRIVKILILLLVIGGIAGAGYWQRNAIMAMVANLRSTSTPAPKPAETAQPAGRPKIADRVGGDTSPSNANAPAASVAQKVVLYDEDSSDPQGKRYVGSALWRTETVSPGPGLAPELAIRADVEIPERRLRMTWSLRRNTDKALPASHTIEIMFTLPADFAEGGIANVPGVLMKQNEQARGAPLAGLAVKVTNGYFLIGLSAVDVDVQRNLQLLKERDWFDIPVVYTSGKRAILAIEKGTPGARAFEEAFRAWGQ